MTVAGDQRRLSEAPVSVTAGLRRGLERHGWLRLAAAPVVLFVLIVVGGRSWVAGAVGAVVGTLVALLGLAIDMSARPIFVHRRRHLVGVGIAMLPVAIALAMAERLPTRRGVLELSSSERLLLSGALLLVLLALERWRASGTANASWWEEKTAEYSGHGHCAACGMARAAAVGPCDFCGADPGPPKS